ncbi:MAG: dihydrodipicolinate synthase family protein [Anaerolineaceae bacterium]|nr:dihydrodipicolinate synthase family protein [Anaerolineaceae bacterium]
MTIKLAGLYPPITIPFNRNEDIVYTELENNVKKWVSQPLDGIVVPGSNSEAVHLTWEERIQIWRVCALILKEKGKYFIAGVGGDATRQAINMLHKAGELGADAALMLPPYFYKPALSHEVLTGHFQKAADESPIPLLLYNVPVFTGVDFSLQTLLELAEHPNIIGMKDSSSNVVKSAQLIAKRPDFQVFAGTGSALLPFLSLGAVGGIMALANFAALPLRKLYDAFKAGEMDNARKLQLSLAEINTAVTSRFGVPGLKYCMTQTGFYGGPPRRPLMVVPDSVQKELDSLLKSLQLNNDESDV